MRLGAPFIAPRQLGAAESIPGRQFLPSVAWRTGQSGAPPDTVQCGFLSYTGAADRWRFGAIGAPDTVRCTPDSPVPPSDRWLGHTSRVDCAADRWLCRPLAQRTVRCTTGQSGAPPDSPVIYSHVAFLFSRECPVDAEPAWGTGHYPVLHRTVRCARPELVLAELCQLYSNSNLLFLALFLALR